MKINIKKHLLALLAVPALAISVSATPVLAADLTLRGGVDSSKSDDQPPSLFGDGGIFDHVLLTADHTATTQFNQQFTRRNAVFFLRAFGKQQER